jgi:hypothetical protein
VVEQSGKLFEVFSIVHLSFVIDPRGGQLNDK